MSYARFLYHHVHARPASQPNRDELGMCTLLVVYTLRGAALPALRQGYGNKRGFPDVPRSILLMACL